MVSLGDRRRKAPPIPQVFRPVSATVHHVDTCHPRRGGPRSEVEEGLFEACLPRRTRILRSGPIRLAHMHPVNHAVMSLANGARLVVHPGA